MTKQETPTTYTYVVSANDINEYRDLTLRLALKTLLYKSFQDVDLDTVLTILRSEADDLQHKMLKPPELVGVAKMEDKPW